MSRNCEAQSHLHARGVVLDLAVDGPLQFGEGDNLVESPGHISATQTHDRAAQVDVLTAGQQRCDSRPHLDQRSDSAGDLQSAGRWVHHPTDNLQERGLAGTVGADERPGLAGLDSQIDVAQHPAPALTFLPSHAIADGSDSVL